MVTGTTVLKEQATVLEHMYFFLKFVEQFAKEAGEERRPYAVDTWENAFRIWDWKMVATEK